MSAYMRDQFAFAGISSPARRALARDALAALPPPTPAQLATTARGAWRRPEREYQYFACDYVDRYVRVCGPEFLGDLRWLVTHKSWWDTVDALAHSVGKLVLAYPELGADMDVWIDDGNFWVARVALLHQIGYKDRTDTKRLFHACERRATDSEFFVRKAIGWALRSYARTDMRAVRAFVDAHPELSPLSRREALKHA
jgi:3-methyladenine DNA glycosylase AlkD